MQSFAYSTPPSVAEAARTALQEDAKLMAGGQTLLQSMKLGLIAPSAVIDISGIAELKGITVAGGKVTIGAGTTHAAVAASRDVQTAIPALAELASHIGDRQVRNRGTLGGSLANNDPAACYPAAVMGLDASVQTNKRTLTAEQFFTGMFSTALQDGEARACELGAQFKIKSQRLTDVNMVFHLKITSPGRAPASHHDVAVLAQAPRNAVMWQVGYSQQQGLQFNLNLLKARAGHFQLSL